MSCPICSKRPAQKYAPFCSKRCADVDLARWLNGSYAIATEEVPDEDTGNDGPDTREIH
ncbi:DNA gyrase inhibitor YacG [Tropicimonas marinistellae]|uniref:DNA gyrase inhibitor YacG n=1 Tax=Tropicimonas marinistellae TaxID=1739787 RepID=UPI00082D77A9|nr:DNA gyrase inhibitor YacG [Tropicimonas marinistellae]